MMSRLEKVGATSPPLELMGSTFLEQAYADPEELSGVVTFLDSDESKFVTAEHISVDGGSQHF